MTEISLTAMQEVLMEAGNEPITQQRRLLELMERNIDGDEILVDPSNPAVFLLGVAIASGVNAITENRILTRRQYPYLAMTEAEVYLHMSHRDHLNRFAQPSFLSNIELRLALDEVRRYAVPTGVGNVKKLTIPQNTQFMVDDLVFTLEYPIEIRIMSHGGPSVQFGNPSDEPTRPLETNIIQWESTYWNDIPILALSFPAYQFQIINHLSHLNAATVFNETYSFADEFFFAKVYMRRENTGTWTEINTTHTDLVFDPAKVTATLEVAGRQLTVKIPQIYYSYGMVSGEIKTAIYTTKGNIDRYLGEYENTAWGHRWIDNTSDDIDQFSAAMSMLATVQMWSSKRTTGGRPALSFTELRNRVVRNNVGDIIIPITLTNLDRSLEDLGYGKVIDLNDLTRRRIWATRDLQLTENAGTVSPPATLVSALTSRLTDLAAHSGVSDNGERITLHPSILYKFEGGVVNVVSDADQELLSKMRADVLARTVSSGGYLYTPFHYVFDATNGQFSARAYYLDDPVVDSRQFVAENDTAALELAAANIITVERKENGWLIRLLSNTGETYRNLEDDQIQVQLAFLPVGESTRAYLNGTLFGRNSTGELVWEFFLESSFDLDAQDSLYLNNFTMFNGNQRPYPTGLTTTFDLIYTVSNYTVAGMVNSDIDAVKNQYMLPYDAIGVFHEQVTIGFGDALTYLWSGSRTIPTAMDYEVYESDEVDVWLTDQFKRDENNAIVFERVNGLLEPAVEFHAGEVKLDAAGNPLYKGRVGDLRLDASGNPIAIGPRRLARQVDMFFLDGRYYFATATTQVNYLKEAIVEVRDRVTKEISDLNIRALENTFIYYRPQNRIGDVTVIVEEGRETTLQAEQYIKVLVYLSKEDHSNEELKESLRQTIKTIVASEFETEAISTDEVTDRIREESGVETLGLRMSGLGGDKNYLTVTNTDSAGRLTIRKKLTPLPDNTFIVEDDIDIDIKRHLPSRNVI